MKKPMRDFTHGELQWQPWITPVDLDMATAEQLTALKVTPSNRAVGAYSLVLAHDPEALSERSPLYNGIMFGAKGLPRADRELGAVAASCVNGCAYCASVHALRFTQLSKQPEVMERIQADGVDAALEPRLKAILDYSAKLSRDPASVDPDVHIYTRSKLAWVTLPESVPAFDVYYDSEKLWPAESLERLEALKTRGS